MIHLIAITSMVNAIYFLFSTLHFFMVQYILGGCISFVLVVQCPISFNSFGRKIQFTFRFQYIRNWSYPVPIDLYCSLILIRYGDTTVQSNCTVLVHFAPLTYYNLVPASINSRAHATILTCTTVSTEGTEICGLFAHVVPNESEY